MVRIIKNSDIRTAPVTEDGRLQHAFPELEKELQKLTKLLGSLIPAGINVYQSGDWNFWYAWIGDIQRPRPHYTYDVDDSILRNHCYGVGRTPTEAIEMLQRARQHGRGYSHWDRDVEVERRKAAGIVDCLTCGGIGRKRNENSFVTYCPDCEGTGVKL
jgi:hypothetical protein